MWLASVLLFILGFISLEYWLGLELTLPLSVAGFFFGFITKDIWRILQYLLSACPKRFPPRPARDARAVDRRR